MEKNTDLKILADKIYCYGFGLRLGKIRIGFYYVWNKYKRKMIQIKGFDEIDNEYNCLYSDNERQISYHYPPDKCNNEYLQAMRQGYEFTFKDHIYEKNNNYYIYNNNTLKYDEILDDLKCEINVTNVKNKKNCTIGENEKCKSCDPKETEFCGSCNDGYYLSEKNRTKCTQCSIEKCKVCPNDYCLHCFDDDKEIK